MNIKSASLEPEFSHPLSIEKISATGTLKSLEASPEERRRLAARFGLLELPKLHAELTIDLAHAGNTYAVTGRITADVIQKCVVTLEPVPAHIEHDIEVLYAIDENPAGPQTEIRPDEMEIEPLENGVIDLGELVAQNLGIALDPYPRKPGVAFRESLPEEVVTGPLAKLVELKKKKD